MCAMCQHEKGGTDSKEDFLCIACDPPKAYGYTLSCSHKLCLECTKRYILDGLDSNKWSKESLQCPKHCENAMLPSWLISECNLSKDQSEGLEQQQNAYNLRVSRLCAVCHEREGEALQCAHNLCSLCCKEYGLNGMASSQWKEELLCCPSSSGSLALDSVTDVSMP